MGKSNPDSPFCRLGTKEKPCRHHRSEQKSFGAQRAGILLTSRERLLHRLLAYQRSADTWNKSPRAREAYSTIPISAVNDNENL